MAGIYTKKNLHKRNYNLSKRGAATRARTSKKTKASLFIPAWFLIGVLAFGFIFSNQYKEVSASFFGDSDTQVSGSGLTLKVDFTDPKTVNYQDPQEIINGVNNKPVGILGSSKDVESSDPSWDERGFMHFNGRDQYITVSSDVAPKKDFTFELWARTSKVEASSYLIASDAKDGQKSTVGIKTQDKYWWFFGYNDGKKVYIPFPDKSVDTNWHHLVITRKAERIGIYIDGKSAEVSRDVNKYNLDNNSFTIGARQEDGKYTDFFEGDIASIKVYTKSMSPDEIQSKFEAGQSQLKKLVEAVDEN
ncbi:MAG: hypothetical protein OHK0017_08480 [Patescibacteria group bacterium]